jgi:hypothetical protein
MTLAFNLMFVNKKPFLVTFPHNIRFGTVEKLRSRSDAAVLASLKDVFKRYRGGGVTVETILADQEFDSLCGDLASMQVQLNTTARDEHVGNIERYLRTMNE